MCVKVGETKSKARQGVVRVSVGLCPCVGSLKNPMFSVENVEYMYCRIYVMYPGDTQSRDLCQAG